MPDINTFALIIPVRNEIQNLPLLPPYLSIVNEVIFVDGGSTDGTVEYIQHHFSNCKLVKQVGEGKGSALLQGIMAADSTYVIVLDADIPVSLKEVIFMMSLFNRDPDLALIKTSRELEGGGSADLTFIRRLGARGLASVARLLHGVKWTEICYGFWGAKTNEIMNCIQIRMQGRYPRTYPFNRVPYAMSFEFDQFVFLQAHKNRLSILEISSIERERLNGVTSLRAFHDGLRTLLLLLYERFECTSRE